MSAFICEMLKDPRTWWLGESKSNSSQAAFCLPRRQKVPKSLPKAHKKALGSVWAESFFFPQASLQAPTEASLLAAVSKPGLTLIL